MEKLKLFYTLNDYTTKTSGLTYPTVSYVEENTDIYYTEKPIVIHYEIKDDTQLQLINQMVSSIGNKLPLLVRSDLIQEAKLNEQDITSQLHQGEPHVFTATTANDKFNELGSLLENDSGISDYVIAVDGPFEVGSSWDLEIKFKDGITDCIGLFYSLLALSEIPENIFNNCTAVTDFSLLFSTCVLNMNIIPQNLFSKCINAKIFDWLFYYGVYVTGNIPDNLFSNNTAATSFSNLFYTCSCSGNIPENLFKNCINATDFSSAFNSCSGLTGSIPENLFSNCTAVTSFSGTFGSCTGLTGSIPENLFSNCTAVTDFSSTFGSCSGLTGSIPENLFSNNTAVTNFNWTFSNCSGLTGNVPVDNDGTPIYNRSGEGKEGYTTVTSYDNCFANCTGLTDYSSIPTAWK